MFVLVSCMCFCCTYKNWKSTQSLNKQYLFPLHTSSHSVPLYQIQSSSSSSQHIAWTATFRSLSLFLSLVFFYFSFIFYQFCPFPIVILDKSVCYKKKLLMNLRRNLIVGNFSLDPHSIFRYDILKSTRRNIRI